MTESDPRTIRRSLLLLPGQIALYHAGEQLGRGEATEAPKLDWDEALVGEGETPHRWRLPW